MADHQTGNQHISLSHTNKYEEADLSIRSTAISDLHGLQRAIQKPDKTTLTPQNVVQLQSVIGNKAVLQLVRQSQPSQQTPPPSNIPVISKASALQSHIQTARFKDNNSAIEWLTGALGDFLDTLRAKKPENFTEDKMDVYLGRLSEWLSGYAETLLKNKGGKFAEETDFYKNLGMLYNPDVTSEALNRIRAAESNRHYGAKKRTVGASALEHIFHGTVDNVDNPTSVTGYHWEGDTNAVAEGYGAKTNQEGTYGLYQRTVRARAKPSVTKGNVSTFFPEVWSKENIIAAIEYADVVSGRLEATYPSKARGLKMVINDAGFFPDAPENQ